MPVQACRLNGKPGFKWGYNGKCYTYTEEDSAARAAALTLAERQGRAIEANKARAAGN